MRKRSNQRWIARDYVVVPRSILKADISPMALRTWLALASFCYDKDECWPSNQAVLDRMPEGTNLRTIQRAKTELIDKGWIAQERRFHKGRETSSVYHLMLPCGSAVEAVDSRGDGEMATPDQRDRARGGHITAQNNSNRYIKKGQEEKSPVMTVDGATFIQGVGWIYGDE